MLVGLSDTQMKILSRLPKVYKLVLEMFGGTETHPLFFIFTLTSIAGSVFGRQTYVYRTDLLPLLYPNLWVVLLAPQGIGHKSYTMKSCLNLIQKTTKGRSVRVLSSKLTPEALVKALSSSISVEEENLKVVVRDATGLLFSTEFGVLLGKQQYNTGMVALLTDLYDCPTDWSSETITRGKEKLRNVCLGLIAASTPDWMQTMLPEDSFYGGFLSRILFVVQPEDWQKKVALPTTPDIKLEQEIVSELEKSLNQTGEVRLGEEGKKWFEKWYSELPDFKTLLPPLAAYYCRKQDHLFKLALTLQLLSNKNSEVLDVEWLQLAEDLLQWNEEHLLKMLEYISMGIKMRVLVAIEQQLRKYKKLKEGVLIDLVKDKLQTVMDFDNAIKLLIKMGKVRIIVMGGGVGYEYIS